MNKKIILPFVAILVLAVAMVGAASADEVKTVDEVEIRGTIAEGNITVPLLSGSPYLTWDADNFAGFWLDIDDGTSTEVLTISTGQLDNVSRTIDDDELTYTTHPAEQVYEICDKYDNASAKNGDVEIEDETSYWIEGWMAEDYVAVNGEADLLSKLLVEFEGDDKKTLATGEEWDLGSGFALTAKQIDLEGDKVLFSLAKNGKQLDDEVIDSSSGATNQARTYVYTEDIGSEDDVPVFHCYVDAVFRGTDSNIVQVTFVFLIDNEVLEINSGDDYGVMEVKTATGSKTGGSVVLMNVDSSVDLDEDSKEHIMGDMYFKIGDDTDMLRFYPMVEKTIGEAPGDADEEEVETPTDTNVTADVNVTPTAVVTPTAEEVATAPEDDVTADVDTTEDAEETATEKKTPGFEAVFAIAGLLAVAYLVLRQRE